MMEANRLQIHRLDRGAPKKEIMRALNDVIEKGWVRYIGASSMAAWEFQQLQVSFSSSITQRRQTKDTRSHISVLTKRSQEYRRNQQLPQIHQHAKLPQPPLPRRRARNDPLLQSHWCGFNPLVTHGSRYPRSPLVFSNLHPRILRQHTQSFDPQ